VDILEVIKSKEVDIYISLLVMLLGLGIGLIIDSIRQKNNPRTLQNNGSISSTTVTNIINANAKENSNNTSSNDEGLPILIGGFLLISGVIYLFNRIEIINTMYYLTIFIVSIWSGGIFHSLVKGNFSGWRWVANLMFYGVFFIFTFKTVNKALSPNYAPKNFEFSQQIIHQYGVLSLGDFFTFLDFKWFTFHLIGILLLFFAMVRLTLSTTYFSVMGNYVISENSKEPWVAKKTRKYAYFWENIVIISIMLFISYFFIAGNFFMWFEYQLPKELDAFINKVLHGR